MINFVFNIPYNKDFSVSFKRRKKFDEAASPLKYRMKRTGYSVLCYRV